MEALVNYNSDDEQEEIMVHTTAERGNRRFSPSRARHSFGNDPTMKNQGSSVGGRKETPTTRNNNNRDEEFQRQKSTTYGNNNRFEASTSYGRENTRDRDSRRDDDRDRRDSRRESRDNTRDHRDDRRHTKDSSRSDFKGDRTRSRDNKCEYNRERDGFDNRRAPRDDNNYRRSSPSSYKSSRYSGNERDERPRYDSSSSTNTTSTSFRQPHHNRPYNHRHSDHHEQDPERSSSRNRRRSSSRSPSPSPSHRHNHHHHHHHKRSTHDDKSHSRRRSRSRSRSITPKRSSSRDRDRESYALEQARKSALEMERKIGSDDFTNQPNESHTISSQRGVRTETLLSLPLSETAPKQPKVIAVAPVSTSFNNGEPAVIQLPSYYNPNVINPNKYAEQVQKRKLLWGAKKAEDTAKKWGNAQFSQDTDGKVASKFMRLMGIKGGSVHSQGEGEEVEKKVVPSVAPDVKTREVMFSNMEQQYEVARQVTHTMRGVGLGFSSQARPF